MQLRSRVSQGECGAILLARIDPEALFNRIVQIVAAVIDPVVADRVTLTPQLQAALDPGSPVRQVLRRRLVDVWSTFGLTQHISSVGVRSLDVEVVQGATAWYCIIDALFRVHGDWMFEVLHMQRRKQRLAHEPAAKAKGAGAGAGDAPK